MFPFLSFNYYKHIVYFTLHFVKSILHLKAKKERNCYMMMDTKSKSKYSRKMIIKADVTQSDKCSNNN